MKFSYLDKKMRVKEVSWEFLQGLFLTAFIEEAAKKDDPVRISINDHRGYYCSIEQALKDARIGPETYDYLKFKDKNVIFNVDGKLLHSIVDVSFSKGLAPPLPPYKSHRWLAELVEKAISAPEFGGILYIAKNPHFLNKESIEEYLFTYLDCGLPDNEKESYKQIIANCEKENVFYEIQYYPESPRGFHMVHGTDLNEMAKEMLELIKVEEATDIGLSGRHKKIKKVKRLREEDSWDGEAEVYFNIYITEALNADDGS